jgi:hypothetical protein
MLKKPGIGALGVLFLLAFGLSSAHANYGERWDYLGETHIDATQDHHNILVERRDGAFRALRMRVSDDGDIFFLRVVVSYSDASSAEIVIHDRILAGGQTPTIDLPGSPRVIESVQLWYFKGAWAHPPKVILFGRR